MNRSLSLLIFAIIQSSVCLLAKDSEQDHLEQGFINPPQEARPWVYFWWQNNLASKEGVTKDLEELKAKGMAGVVLVSAGGPAGPMPDGPDYMSTEWRNLMKHTINEAARLGLEVSFNQCGGWNSGGPWITEEMASQQYVSSELTLKGPQTFRGKLPQAPGNAKAYRDIAVQAFRVAEATERSHLPKATVTASSSRDDMPLTGLTDGDMHVNSRKFWGSKGLPTKEHPEWIQFSLAEPASIQSVWILPRDGHGPRDIEIRASLDGHDFKTISKKTLTDWGEQLVSFPATVVRDLRIVITSSHCNYNSQLLEIGLQLPLVAVQRQHAIKAARDSFDPTGPLRKVAELPLEPSTSILKGRIEEVVNLTSNLAEDGTLTWDVPAGEWTIVRSGHTTTGHRVSFAPKGGGGLEKDWLSREAADLHFKNMTQVILEDSAEHVGSTIKYFYDDSWEAGMPNWTPALIDEFKKYRGYDPSPYLPVLAGYTVGNLDVSDRFLYDYRKTIADCLADNHYGHLTKLANERGMMTHNQGGGPCSGYLMTMDALKNLGRSTVPMGEFWYSGQMKEGNLQNKAGKQAASAAHIYGKRWVKGEAFTSIGPHWEESPQSLKPTADIAFCEGFNRFTFHTYTSSRPEDGKPGYEYFAGTHFNRNITWWDQMPAWTEFIARSQWMLSRGLFVADVCFYNGDWAPNYVEPKRVYPELGPGYDYDFCNAEVLLTRMSVKDGRIVLPDGMSYKVLSLPDRDFMPLEVLQKIQELVRDGATVVGPKPVRDPGLKDYPARDNEVKKLADEIWGDCDGVNVKEHRYGKGRVIWGTPLREVLTADGIGPAFSYESGRKDSFVDFIHRRDGDAEIYYIANRLNREEQITAQFRVVGRQPELWDPVTGVIRDAVAFKQLDGVTEVPLDLAQHGSVFVVFRNKIGPDVQGTATSNQQTSELVAELGPKWKVTFDPEWGGPGTVEFDTLSDWTKSTDEGIRYYSGTAVYEHPKFDLPAGTDLKDGERIFLDLGDVREVAEVFVNGKAVGTAWTRPFQVDITEALKPEGNQIEIHVVNLWPNRLIYEDGLSEDQRLTNTNVSKFKKEMQPYTSGLLGPVRILKSKPFSM
jgi:hypothetical protein